MASPPAHSSATFTQLKLCSSRSEVSQAAARKDTGKRDKH